jgi:hypothetical protein
MSENTINTQIDGTIIQASHVNQYKTALVEDLVPRDLSGAPDDEAGGLGTDIFRWAKSVISKMFTNKLSIGAEGNESDNPSLTATLSNLLVDVIAAKNIQFRVGGSVKGRVDTDGFDGQYLKALSVSSASLGSNSVSTAKITDLNVTEGKIAVEAVTTNKIGNLSVTNIKIADGTIVMHKLRARSVETNSATVLTDDTGSTYHNRTYDDTGRTGGFTASYNGGSVTVDNASPCVVIVDAEINSSTGTGTLASLKIRARGKDYNSGNSNSTASFIVAAGENITVNPRYELTGSHSNYVPNITFRVYILR